MTGTQQEYDAIQNELRKGKSMDRIKQIIEYNDPLHDITDNAEMIGLLKWAWLKIGILAHALDIARAQLNKHDSATDEDMELFTEALRDV